MCVCVCVSDALYIYQHGIHINLGRALGNTLADKGDVSTRKEITLYSCNLGLETKWYPYTTLQCGGRWQLVHRENRIHEDAMYSLLCLL